MKQDRATRSVLFLALDCDIYNLFIRFMRKTLDKREKKW